MRTKLLLSVIAFVLCGCFAALAQNRTIKGIVKDRQGQPLPGVSVKVKGSTQGVSTGVDGAYAISTANDATLVFTYIGFQTAELPVNNRNVLNVTLSETNRQLNEVVVVGYGTQRRGDLTTAISSVNTRDIGERPIVQAAQALQGKTAGIQVTQPSGKPGSALSIRVRGATSVQAGNEPLYVIDGVPTTDSRDLNVNDIESIQVLKDASSAAIYGARAANGVVIVTTKRGKANTPLINLNVYYGISNISKKIDVLDGQQYTALMNEMVPNQVPGNTNINTDWNNEVFKQGTNQSYQLSFSGGSERSQYFVSGGITKDEGIVRPAEYNRYAFRVNLDNQIKDWFKVTSNFTYSNVNSKDVKDNTNAGRNAAILGALNAPPIMGIYTTDTLGRRQYTSNILKAGWDNPIAAMEGPTQGSKDHRMLGNIIGDLIITKGLNLKSNFGIDYFNHRYDYYLDYIMTTPGRLEHGTAEAEKSNSFTYLWENTLNFQHNWDKHNFSALGGVTIQDNNFNNSYIHGRDFPEDTSVKTLNAANVIDDAYTSEKEWFLNSYLGRVIYNFNSKYYVTGNFRADGSSKLAPGKRWGFFPSVSAAWRISAEPFFENLKFIDDLKIRGGWGKNGNQEGLANYASYALGSFSRQTPSDPPSGPIINPSRIAPNQDLKWEVTTQTNIGLDVSMLNSRLTLTADAYIKKTDGLLLNVPLPSQSGYDYITRNSGKMENKGLEFVISSVNTSQTNFKWNTDFNISFNKNRVTELELTRLYSFGGIEGRGNVSIVQPGSPLGTFFGYISEGVDPSTGNIIYRDINGDGAVTPTDRTIIGSAQPDFVYGLNNDFTYKRWNLTLLFQGSQGNDIFNASRIETEGMYDSKNQSTEVLRRWTSPGQVTDIPRAANGNISNSEISSRFIEDGSYLRLKSASISYALPGSIANKIKMSGLSVYITGQNLFTITNYKGFDPEVNAFNTNTGENSTVLGVDYGTYPQSRAFILGVNVRF